MSDFAVAPSGAPMQCLFIHVVGEANALLRLLEPFVIHDVKPVRVVSDACADGFEVRLEFRADADLARRLEQRVGAQVTVELARLGAPVIGRLGAAA